MNLVIGNTSQQSYYYPEDFLKISSRDIDFKFLMSNEFDSVYITFAEQRIYEKNIDYMGTNFNYTLNIIKSLIEKSKKIVIFTSCELWANLSGVITIDAKPNFDLANEYSLSKLALFNEIKGLRCIDERYNKVAILHPFYFNSSYRSQYFLFGKIFDSIVNRKKINVGNLDFYRDMIHTSFLVKKAMELESDSMVGSGKLFNVRDFIIDLYKSFNMDFHYYVEESKDIRSADKNIRADVKWEYNYSDLLKDTIDDIELKMRSLK
jgi:GDP-D-mannose dehydratase